MDGADDGGLGVAARYVSGRGGGSAIQ
jgi:hypothetical protein